MPAPEPAPTPAKPQKPANGKDDGYGWVAPDEPKAGIEPEQLRRFPWPPPKFSSSEVLPRAALVARSDAKTLGAVADVLESALRALEHSQFSYYSVPGGFALATHLERIADDGSPVADAYRWSDDDELRSFDIAEIVKRLLGAPPGRFRVIVFVVTPKSFAASPKPPTAAEAKTWAAQGNNKLPAVYYRVPVPAETDCTALVYEFERLPVEKDARQVVTGITAREHLLRSGIAAQLRLDR